MDQSREIAEAAAEGDIRAIYADLKASFDAPMVNLIYRRMAAIPGGLSWAWSTVRPLARSGDLAAAAEELLGGIDHGAQRDISAHALAKAGVDGQGPAIIRGVIDAYNRSNPMNLIVTKVLMRALDTGRPALTYDSSASAVDSRTPPSLPPLVDMDQTNPETVNLLHRLARQATGGSEAIIPSLYRHFGEWPGFLSLAEETVAPLADGEGLHSAATALEHDAEAIATRLLGTMNAEEGSLAAPMGQELDAMRDLLELFPPAICALIVIGGVLRRSLPS